MLLVLQTLGKLLWSEKRNFAFFFCAIDKRHSVLYSDFNHFLFASVRETSSHSRFSSLNFAQFCLFLILHFVGSFFVSLLHCTFLFVYLFCSFCFSMSFWFYISFFSKQVYFSVFILLLKLFSILFFVFVGLLLFDEQFSCFGSLLFTVK